jgi:dihydrofolate reductase
MGKVMAGFTMSLDGFVADPNDDVSLVFKWYSAGDVDFPLPGTNRVFKISQASADYLTESWNTLGAIVTGRRDFDVSNAWGGKALMDLPTFIVTHHPPQEWLHEGSPFTFVTEGVEVAIERARAAAGEKNVGVGGTQIVQQALRAGLIDQIDIDLAPVLLGAGIRLFDNLPEPIELEIQRVVEGTGVTHISYRVVK